MSGPRPLPPAADRSGPAACLTFTPRFPGLTPGPIPRTAVNLSPSCRKIQQSADRRGFCSSSHLLRKYHSTTLSNVTQGHFVASPRRINMAIGATPRPSVSQISPRSADSRSYAVFDHPLPSWTSQGIIATSHPFLPNAPPTTSSLFSSTKTCSKTIPEQQHTNNGTISVLSSVILYSERVNPSPWRPSSATRSPCGRKASTLWHSLPPAEPR